MQERRRFQTVHKSSPIMAILIIALAVSTVAGALFLMFSGPVHVTGPSLSADTTSLVWPDAAAGQCVSSNSFTITNDGNVPLVLVVDQVLIPAGSSLEVRDSADLLIAGQTLGPGGSLIAHGYWCSGNPGDYTISFRVAYA